LSILLALMVVEVGHHLAPAGLRLAPQPLVEKRAAPHPRSSG
jgi:hypothetical protein